MKKISLYLTIFLSLVGIVLIAHPVYADLQSAEYKGVFPQNNLTFWNPEECSGGGSSGGNVAVCGTSLPAETISKIESDGIKEAIEKNMERYKYGEAQTGLPWQILATLHWREGGAGSNASISNGEELYDHVNVDGVHVSADPNQDAVDAAHHFIDLAKEVYGIDVLTDKSQDAYGYGFLAYNRGYMYKCNGNVSYTESPYVMNFFDEAHQNMVWSSADSLDCNGNALNNVAGSTNSQVGALAIVAYLCGNDPSSSSSSTPTSSGSSGSGSTSGPATSSSGSSSGSSGSSASSGDGSDVTIIGDSITVASESAIKEKLPNADIHAQNCKTVGYDVTNGCGGVSGTNQSGLNVVKGLKSSNSLRDKVVIALGTNTSGFEKLQEVINEIGNRQIYLMTLWETGNDHADQNSTIEQLAKDNSNIDIFDWASVAKSNGGSYLEDGTHPNSEGAQKFAELIANAVSGSNCPSGAGGGGDYPQYFQAGQAWSGVSYDGGNIGDSGCGPSSMAMIASAVTGQEILPNDVVDVTSPGCYVYTSGSGMTDLDKKVGEKYGFEVVNVDYSSTEDAIEKMKKYLSEGYMLHFSGAGSAPFTSGGHYVGAFAIDGDTVKVADSNLGNADYNVGDLVRAGLHGGAFSASKGSGTKTCSGDAICNDGPGSGGSGGMVEGGLTEEQAQKIADYYNSSAVSAAGLPMGTKENCVSFSAWFVSYLTDVTDATNPTRGDGLDVAGNLAADFGLQTSQTPQIYSVFSNPSGTPVNGSSNHTGVIVGIEGNEVITIEAAWGGWAGQSDGLARVWRYTMPESGMLYAELNGHIDTSKLSSIVGG